MMASYLCSTILAFFNPSSSFEELCGKNNPGVWEAVKTQEDSDNLNFFKTHYFQVMEQPNVKGSIPQIIHFVWLSEISPSKKMINNLQSWHHFHPNWVIKCWTKGEVFSTHLPICWSDLHFLRQPPVKNLNKAEEAEWWRYQILAQEGGVIIDPALECMKSFESLTSAFNFFAALNFPSESGLSSSIFPSRSVIGALREHPIVQEMLHILQEQWKTLDLYYPVVNEKSMKRRLNFRFSSALDEAIKFKLDDQPFKNVVLPAVFFDQIGKPGRSLKEEMQYTPWVKKRLSSFVFFDKLPQEIQEESFIDQMKKTINKILVVDLTICLINLFVIFRVFRSRQRVL